jgi:hypothetical protein
MTILHVLVGGTPLALQCPDLALKLGYVAIPLGEGEGVSQPAYNSLDILHGLHRLRQTVMLEMMGCLSNPNRNQLEPNLTMVG